MSALSLSPFAQIAHLPIDWDLSPEIAVTLYLEWGNNDWRSAHPPVRSASDVSYYFVVDAWEKPLSVRLVQRSSEQAVDLLTLQVPDRLAQAFYAEYGELKGIFEPISVIKDWLKHEIEQA